MESFLNRYRNITVLLLVIFAQLVLLAIQVKNDQDVRVIRIWAVSTVTPVARVVEWFRGGSIGFVRQYILLHDASLENRKLRDEVGRLRIENNFLRNELSTADRAKALQVFQAHTPSKMIAANVIGRGAGSNAQVVFVSRGSAEGVMRGMAVVTPDGIVGKVMAAYPTASEVLLITDPEFAAGVISQKTMARGTVKGQENSPLCKVEHIPLEDKIEVGEWFYTSGDDRVFPRGFAVGVVKSVKPGPEFQDIVLQPSGIAHGLEDVLILLESVHQAIPDAPPANQPVYIAPPPPAQETTQAPTAVPSAPGDQPATTAAPAQGTEADKLRSIYKSVGDSQKHTFGSGPPGSKPPDFTKLPATPAAAQAAAGAAAAPPASGTPAGGAAAAPGTKSGAPGASGAQAPAAKTPGGGAAPGKAARPAGANPGSTSPAPATPKSGPPAKDPGGAPQE